MASLKATARIQQNEKLAQEFKEKAEEDIEESIWDKDPLKHFVRCFGWLDIMNSYQTKRSSEGKPGLMKYLTLPGKNATDIGLLWHNGLIQPDQQGNLNVAICDEKHAETVAANLSRFGHLLAYSGKRFLASINSNDELITHFPFDVINLDLCNRMSYNASPKKTLENHATIRRIFRLQRGQGFLLFLTYRAASDQNTINDLLPIISNNLDNEPLFSEEYIKVYGAPDPQLSLSNTTQFNRIVYPKLIARYGRDYAYRTKEHFCGIYPRHDKHEGDYSMICHSFEFEPILRASEPPSNKYSPRYKAISNTEMEEKMKESIPSSTHKTAIDEYVNSICELPTAKSIDINDEFTQHPELRSDLTQKATGLVQWWNPI